MPLTMKTPSGSYIAYAPIEADTGKNMSINKIFDDGEDYITFTLHYKPNHVDYMI